MFKIRITAFKATGKWNWEDVLSVDGKITIDNTQAIITMVRSFHLNIGDFVFYAFNEDHSEVNCRLVKDGE